MDRGNLEVERDRILAYKTVFASDTEKEASGVSRIVLEDIRDFAQYDTFYSGADSTYVARMAGRREVYAWIIARIEYNRIGEIRAELLRLETEE